MYPGVTALVERLVARALPASSGVLPRAHRRGPGHDRALELPQIVRPAAPQALERAAALFRRLTDASSRSTPEEAELAKLFTNTWRYIKFAAANQLYMIANDFGCDYERIRAALTDDYPRAADLPGAGFAAGPCLLKDTMQLAAFNDNSFPLGHASMMVNEGLPLYLVAQLEKRYDLEFMTVGHPRHGVQGRVRRHPLQPGLQAEARARASRPTRCSPPTPTSPTIPTSLPLDEVLERSPTCWSSRAPHRAYRDLETDQAGRRHLEPARRGARV